MKDSDSFKPEVRQVLKEMGKEVEFLIQQLNDPQPNRLERNSLARKLFNIAADEVSMQLKYTVRNIL